MKQPSQHWTRLGLGVLAAVLVLGQKSRDCQIAQNNPRSDAFDAAVVEWVEKAAVENLRARLATGDHLASQASSLLAILLIGIGGGLGYSVKLAESYAASSFIVGMICATAWLCVIAAVLTTRCIVTRNTEVLRNDPKNLYQPAVQLSLAQVRAFELENIQVRISRARFRNAKSHNGYTSSPAKIKTFVLTQGRFSEEKIVTTF